MVEFTRSVGWAMVEEMGWEEMQFFTVGRENEFIAAKYEIATLKE